MKKLSVLISLFLFTGCLQDVTESIEVAQPQRAEIVRLSDNNMKGSMIVRFDEQAITRVEAGVTRSGATRSGIDHFDSVLEQIGAKKLERVFVSNRFEERLRNEGMHRWYIVTFDEAVDVNTAAEQFAEVAEVELVQFNAQMKQITDVKHEPTTTATTPPTTMATDLYPKFNDPELGRQWHYINVGDTSVYTGAKPGADINAGEAWDITAGDNRIVVAIIDGMVKYDHPDLAANMWVNQAEKSGAVGVDDDGNGYVDDIYGVNFVQHLYDGQTTIAEEVDSDHGTHVAGTVAAVNNNGIGGCGVAGGTGNGDGARLMACQVFHGIDKNDPRKDAWQSGAEVATARAFQYAADNGAAIAQCSWGYAVKMESDQAYSKSSNLEKTAIDYFIRYGGGEVLTGGLPIFAAGNEQSNFACYPGAYRDYLCVTAFSCDFTPAYYTNYGPGSNITAPGGDYLQRYYTDGTGENNSDVFSTAYLYGLQYDYKQGTSMACPHVSGVAALAIAHSLNIGKKLTTIELRNILLGSTHNIDRYCSSGTKTGATLAPPGQPSQITTINLNRFHCKMGVGYIDAFKTLMNVQGTPCFTVRVGYKQSVDISDVIGGNPTGMTFINGGVSMSQSDREKLGIEGDITISQTGKLQIKCTKIGSAVLKITFIAGGSNLGSDEATGGMAITREVAVLSRNFASNGGWL